MTEDVHAAGVSGGLHADQQLRLALSAGRLGTWRWDMATGHTEWDATLEQLFGVAPGAFDGTFDAWIALLHPDDVAASMAVLDRAVADRQPYDIEHRVVWADGSTHWLRGRGQVITDEHGTVTGTIGFTSDVTDQKLAEAESARRLEEAERNARRERLQRERFEFLAKLNDVVIESADYRELMARTTAAVVPRLGDWCQLHYFPQGGGHERRVSHADASTLEWAATALDNLPYNPNSRFGVPHVIRTGQTEFYPVLDASLVTETLSEATKLALDALQPVVAALQLTSIITVPLVTKRGVVGGIQFVSAESKRRYDKDDVALAEAIAGRVGEALDNAWLTEQQRKVSTTLQAALLPTSLPDIPGVSLAVRYWAAGPASDVGGDFYDVFPIGNDTWALVIGDVCGTGAEAAAVTAIARHTIRAAAIHGASHIQVMNWCNDAIIAARTGLFCTVLYSTLHKTRGGSWRYTSVAGGHPLPVLVDKGVWASMVGKPGTLIGVLQNIRVTVSETVLVNGSTLVLHTDGVNDVRPPYGLDDDELAELVVSCSKIAGDADDVAERLGQAIERILPIPERDDDVAVVVLRVG